MYTFDWALSVVDQFWKSKPYAYGNDPAFLDKLYARRDEIAIKLAEGGAEGNRQWYYYKKLVQTYLRSLGRSV